MLRPRLSSLAAVLALLTITPTTVLAQWRCDCTTIVASCIAEVAVRENWIDVTTDGPRCSRVDYFVDGMPFVATVVEGRERQNWISPRANPEVLVQSCQVCAENTRAASTQAAADSADDDDGLEPLIRWSPQYPKAAEVQGLEGHIRIEFDVTPAGDVVEPIVTESEPAGVFDDAALAAVSRWRYASDPQRETVRVTEQIDFSIGDLLWQLQPPAETQADAALTRIPRNRCVREDAAYDYGEMIEAGLINACDDPIVVYGCAHGVGRQVGRWVCSDSARLGVLLVPPGDRRIGSTLQNGAAVDSIEWLTFTENFFIAHAPNSQYWWVACGLADGACREDAQMWVRSVDRQPVSVDPSRRAGIAVARSY
jgi:TonB family protein